MSVKLFIKQNAPTILTFLGAAGVVATAVTAVKATPKASYLLYKAEEEKGEELTLTEKATIAGPVYIPSVLIGVGTVTCIFGANVLNKRTQAALTSAYALLDNSYKEYRNKVKETYGEDYDDLIKEEIAKDKYKEQDIHVDEGVELFFDEYSGRYFESTKYKVKEAQYQLNRDLVMRDYAYLNEFYHYLGIEEVDFGWKAGWSVGSCMDMYWQPWIDFTHSKVVMDDGLECTRIIMFQEPIMNFEDYC